MLFMQKEHNLDGGGLKQTVAVNTPIRFLAHDLQQRQRKATGERLS